MITDEIKEGYSQEAIAKIEAAHKIDVPIDEQITLYSQAIALCPLPAYAYAKRGQLKYKQNDFLGAIDDLNIAIDRKPFSPITLWCRAKAKYEINEYQAAIDDYFLFLKLRPNDIEAYENIGNIYEKIGEHDQALKNFKEILKIDEENQIIIKRTKSLLGIQ